MTDEVKGYILGVVRDLVSDFLYYDRKEDEELALGEIEVAIANGVIGTQDIVDEFERVLKKELIEVCKDCSKHIRV